MSKFRKQIGANIQDIRKSRGLTQEQLAEQISLLANISITRGAVGHWESGKRLPTSEALMYLSIALNCPYSAFYRGIDKRIEMNSTVEQMMVEFKSLPERDQQTVLDVATVFEGDKLALIRYLQLCYLDISREYWRETVAYGIYIRQKAEEAGTVRPSPDMEYVVEAWRKLYG